MQNVIRWLTWLLVVTLLAGCVMPPMRTNTLVAPEAGRWQTWVVTDVTTVRPAAPPDEAATRQELQALKAMVAGADANTMAQVAYWDAGAPSYRWLQIALAQIKSKPLSNPRVARGLALLNVAMYDGLVATWNAKYSYNRPRPGQLDPTLATLVTTPDSPSYPAEHAVVAGAAAAILSYLYPDDAATFQAKAEEAGQSRVIAGVQYSSDIQAGFELGRAVAEQVLERAKADGSDAQWDGVIPNGPGHWVGEKPIEPLAGTWQPWVLTSTDEFRPPAPPAIDSPQLTTELQEIKAMTNTWQSTEKALYWQTFDGIFTDWYVDANQYIFEEHLDTNPPEVARIYAAMSIAQYDAILACWDAKYTYWSIRPNQLDERVATLFPTPRHPSYPSSHACDSSAIAGAMEVLFPTAADYLRARANEAALSRLWAGIHFRSDIDSGLTLGRAVAEKVMMRVQPPGR